MIHLKLTSETPPKTYIFQKKLLFIGHPTDDLHEPLDLILIGDDYTCARMCIEVADEGVAIAFNTTNDPFTTINNIPFAKKILKAGDIIEINQSTLVFEGLFSAEIQANEDIKEDTKKVEAKKETSFDLSKATDNLVAYDANKNNHMDAWQSQESLDAPIDEAEIAALLKEVEHLEEMVAEDALAVEKQIETKLQKKAQNKQATLKPIHRSMKDDDLEGDYDSGKESFITRNPPPVAINWRKFFNVTISLIIGLSSVAVISYSIISDRSEEEEMRAAAAVADVAMALNFAKINHAKPQNQNWSDPEFLKINLAAVLAQEFHPLANVDSHGQFQNSSYILRIYTGNDLDHFLVIAQPNANLMQWLIPKATILLDSKYMKLRKTDDLKTLNRLLINPTLNATNSSNISYLVEQEELIPLSLLRKYHSHMGFNVPKALAFIRPGAENLIYNSLRYHRLGEALIKKAIALYESHDDHSDVPLFVQEINEFMKYPDIVLYSSEGLKTATLGQKAIATFLPKHNLLFGYLGQNSKGHHLLMDDKSAETTPILPQDTDIIADSEDESVAHKKFIIDPDILALLNEKYNETLREFNLKIERLIQDETLTFVDKAEELARLKEERKKCEQSHIKKIIMALSLIAIASEQGPGDFEHPIPNDLAHETIALAPFSLHNEGVENEGETKASVHDKELHPLLYKLAAVFHAYHDPLHQISNELNAAPDVHDSKMASSTTKEKLVAKYKKTDLELRKKAIAAIFALQKEYREMPVMQFISHIRTAGLEPLIQESLPQDGDIGQALTNTLEFIDQHIEKINQAMSLKELSSNLSNAYNLLHLEQIPRPALLSTYQNKVRAAAVHRLDLFLLSSQNLLPEDERVPHSRTVLQDIFKKAWITDDDEIDYYLNEFDLLIQHQ